MEIETILLVAAVWCVPALLSLSLARVAGRADQHAARQLEGLPLPVSELPLRRRRVTGGPPAGRRVPRPAPSEELRV